MCGPNFSYQTQSNIFLISELHIFSVCELRIQALYRKVARPHVKNPGYIKPNWCINAEQILIGSSIVSCMQWLVYIDVTKNDQFKYRI
jgi:hypothetical protein